MEIRYADLVESPKRTLDNICDFLGIDRNEPWMNNAASMLRSSANKPRMIKLPPKMSAAFNRYQEHLGFSGRAIPFDQTESTIGK